MTKFPATSRRLAVKAGLVAAALSGLFPGAASAQAPTLLRMNMVVSNQDAHFPLWQQFAKQLEEASKGTLKVEVLPSETLGKTVDMIQAVSRGAPVLQDCDPSHLSNYVPDYAIFMHPFLFKKPEDIEKAWQSDVGRKMEAELNKKGLRTVTAVYFGTRHLISDKEIKTRTDTAGMKLRNAPTKMWNEVSKTLGGNPTNTAWSEVYSALSQGVADGAESPLSLLYSAKLFEAKKRVSLTGHLVATTTLVMSQKVYEGLPPAARQALDTVGRAYPAQRAPQILAIEKDFRAKLETAGVKFNEVDKTSFIQAAKDVSKAFPEWTPGLYDQMTKAIQ